MDFCSVVLGSTAPDGWDCVCRGFCWRFRLFSRFLCGIFHILQHLGMLLLPGLGWDMLGCARISLQEFLPNFPPKCPLFQLKAIPPFPAIPCLCPEPLPPLWALEDAPRIFPEFSLFQAGQSQLSQPGSIAGLFSNGSRCSFQQNTGNVQGYSRPAPDKEPPELPCCVWGSSHRRLPRNPSGHRSPSRCFWVSGHLARSSSRSVGSGSGRGCGAGLGSFFIPRDFPRNAALRGAGGFGMGWGKGDNAPLQIPVSRLDPSDVEFHPGVWDGGIRNMPEIPLKSSTSLWNPEGVGSGASKPKISPEPGTEEAGFYFHGSSSRPCRSIPAP